MDSKDVAWILFLMLVGFTNSDLQKDREECANQLVGLATCLPYVGGNAKAPTPDCCTGLKLVLQNSKKCLCILVKDRNDPSLGLKINATLALSLPTACHAPANVSQCPALLNLAPNSPDAKVFEDFTNSAANAKVNSTGNGSSGEITSDGGRGKRRLVVEMVCSVIISIVVHMSPNL